jgi:F-type H+-transporting ATPase subunit epsilon
MADDRIQLQIITTEGVKYDRMVSYVLLPLDGGSIGVLADHAPLMAAVVDGPVKCTFEGGEEYIYVGTGVVDVYQNKVVLLVRTAEAAETIDLARAKAAEKRAQERLESKAVNVDMARAEASLHRALARVKTYNMWHKQ